MGKRGKGGGGTGTRNPAKIHLHQSPEEVPSVSCAGRSQQWARRPAHALRASGPRAVPAVMGGGDTPSPETAAVPDREAVEHASPGVSSTPEENLLMDFDPLHEAAPPPTPSNQFLAPLPPNPDPSHPQEELGGTRTSSSFALSTI